ncbi:MAG TPA: SDR family oxidoreductase [Candidatus Saccharimonadales bacterium]|nr:SDR family oxidoreductase [Candidatus Saccharimonadales bacterium]
MANKKLLITGGNGLVGSRVVELLSSTYDFNLLNRTSGTDITDKEAVLNKITNSEAEIIIHLAAKTDVDGCEKEKELGHESEAWKINVEGTRNVVDAATAANKKLLYISTDFVFNGQDTPEDGYTEESKPSPVNWYAQTKYEGEKIVQAAAIPWIITRIAYPYRAKFEKNDFARVFKSLLEQGKHLSLITDHFVNATFIDDLAPALDMLISQNQTGIYHLTGSQTLSPYEEGLLVAKTFGLDPTLIGKTTRAEFFKDRATRPFNLRMNNAKIEKLGIKMKSFEEGLTEIKRQLNNP